MVWKKKIFKDGSFTLKERNKFISVHKTLGLYWIDFGIKNSNVLSTMKAKTPTQTRKTINRIKNMSSH